MMGLGDVASILIPAFKIIQRQYANSSIDVLTYGVGVELMTLVPQVNAVLAVAPEQWPSDFNEATLSFIGIADTIVSQHYDLIVNIDTWFMPCFLSRVLKDAGLNVQGNFIKSSIDTLFQMIKSNSLTQAYFENPSIYLDSTFPNMMDWTIPWWEKYANATSYPEFYLQYCCGYQDEIDISLAIEADVNFRQQAAGKKIVALSFAGSKPSKQYLRGHELTQLLEQAGFFVWSQFDGSVSMQTTLSRLKSTDLLITVATSTQWLAKLVGCPSLVISGALPPSILGAALVVDKVQACQYCYQSYCVENLNFACMNVPPEHIFAKTLNYFGISLIP